MSELPVLHVALSGRRIGTLTLLPGEQTLFAFDPAHIAEIILPTQS